jgi:hypothetical protein
MFLAQFGFIVGGIILVLTLIHIYQVKTVPRNQYLEAILKCQKYLNQEWVNEILIRSEVSNLLQREISPNHNTFNLRQMVKEDLIEYTEGVTGISGEVTIDVATFKVTHKGMLKYKKAHS